jgi:hypothetical protein
LKNIMSTKPSNTPRASESRLDMLREEAQRTGTVAAVGAPIVGGPIPRPPSSSSVVGYYGQPVIKPPVWTWQVGLYLFVGGTAGMSGVIALGAFLTGQPIELVRDALALAAAGAVISPFLLIADLGRPMRFFNMLRVFKWRSAMSMGVWILVFFSSCAMPAFLLAEGAGLLTRQGIPEVFLRAALFLFILGTALFGLLLATYTGVLLGATAVPAWFTHHRLLPFHFGIVALGSSVAILELLGFRMGALNTIGLTVAGVETVVGIWIEMSRKGITTRALHEGTAGVLLRIAGLATGPVSLIARLVGWVPVADVCFLLGAIFSRYGWLAAGRASAHDPAATIAEQRGQAAAPGA